MGIDSKIAVAKGDASGRWLLASLFLSLLVLPLFEGSQAGWALLLLGYSLTLVLAAIVSRPKFRSSAWVFPAVAIPIGWATLVVESASLFVAHCLLSSIFLWFAGGVIVMDVIKRRAITIDSVFSAISAYLLFGLAWALSYWAIYTVSPIALKSSVGNSQILDFSHFVYYSFVTMSTLGYGDMTPQHRITRTLSWIQSVTGQFYVAVVIAWLVSALPRPGLDSKQAVRT